MAAHRFTHAMADDQRLPSGHYELYVFGLTASGVVDLLGFVVGTAHEDDLDFHVGGIAATFTLEVPPKGLRSAQVRAAVTQRGLLERARSELASVLDDYRDLIDTLAPGADVDVNVPRGVVRTGRDPWLTDEFLAAFVLRYDAALTAGGTRASVAEVEGRSAKTIENWLEKAKVRGLWLTSGRGFRGQPTPLAHELAKEDN